MRACAKCCSATATLRCGACSAHQAPDRVVYYCNHTCQKAHWATHKVDCYISRLYAGSPAGPLCISPHDPAAYKLFCKLPREVAEDFVKYFETVDREALPPYPTGASHMKAVGHESEFKVPKEEYMKSWEARVPQAMRDLCYTEQEWKVPFNLRPLKSITRSSGAQGQLVELYAQDYTVLSFEEFRRHFGDEQRAGIDPWAQDGNSGTLGRGDSRVEMR